MTEELRLTINEWLDALGIDRAYKKDMKETYQKDIPALDAQLDKVISLIREEIEKIDNPYDIETEYDYHEGAEFFRQDILSILKEVE